jgi:ATP-dependent Clp protease ATP-binding subunit ClpC
MDGEMPLTPRAKKVLQLAVDEAKQLGHDYVGTEHLALGLLHDAEGVAGQLLRARGMEPATARSRVVAILTRQDET